MHVIDYQVIPIARILSNTGSIMWLAFQTQSLEVAAEQQIPNSHWLKAKTCQPAIGDEVGQHTSVSSCKSKSTRQVMFINLLPRKYN